MRAVLAAVLALSCEGDFYVREELCPPPAASGASVCKDRFFRYASQVECEPGQYAEVHGDAVVCKCRTRWIDK